MWNNESWSGEGAMDESEADFEFGRATRASLSRPRPAAGFRRPPGRPLPRPRPRWRRSGGLIWDQPLVFPAAASLGSWNGSLDDPQSLRSLQEALNQIFDQLIRRAEAR